MSEFMLSRFREITPARKLSDMDIIEVERDCKVAFEIVGYNPSDFDDSFQSAWESSEAEDLSDFIFDVWRQSS